MNTFSLQLEIMNSLKIKKCIFYLLYDTIKLYANKFLAFGVLIMKFKSTLDNKLSIPAKIMLTKTAATDNIYMRNYVKIH